MERKLLVSVFILLGFFFNTLGNPYIDSLMRVEAAAKDELTRYSALYDLGQAYYDSAYTKSIHYFEKALEISKKRDAWEQVADIHHHIAMIYFNQGEFNKSLFENQNALSVYIVHNDAKGIGHVNNSIGVLYKTWGRYTKALEHFFLALNDFERIGYRAGIGMASNNIGQIFFYQEDFKKAIDYFTIHYETSKSVGTEYSTAGAANNLAASYVELNDHEKAIRYYKEAAIIYDSLKIEIGVAIINDNIGLLLAKNKDFEGALKYHIDAMQVFENIGNKSRLAYALNNIGYTYFKLNNYTKCVQHLLKGQKIAEELNQQETLKEIYYNLSQVFEATQKSSQALRYHKLYTQLKDSLYSVEVKENLKQMELKQEADKHLSELTYLSGKVEQHRTFILILFLLTVLFISVGVIIIRVINKRKYSIQSYTQAIKANSIELDRMASHYSSSNSGELVILWPPPKRELNSIKFIEYNYRGTKGVLTVASIKLPINYLMHLIKNSIDSHFKSYNTITEQEVDTIINCSLNDLSKNLYISDKQASMCSIIQSDELQIELKNSAVAWVIMDNKIRFIDQSTVLQNKIDQKSVSQLFLLTSTLSKTNQSFISLISLIDKSLKLIVSKSEDTQSEIIRNTIEIWCNSVSEACEVLFSRTKVE